jgi:hypothetical protein
MVAAAGEAGKTLRLRLAGEAAAAVIPQAHRRLLRLAVPADCQHRQGRGSTFKDSAVQLVLATITTAIWVAVVVAAPTLLRLPTVAAGRCLAGAVVARVAERLLSLLQTTQLRAVGRPRVLEPALRLAFLARRQHPAMQVRQATAPMAARAAVVAVQPCKLPRTALRAARAGLVGAVAAAVAVAAIRALAARAASAVMATAS